MLNKNKMKILFAEETIGSASKEHANCLFLSYFFLDTRCYFHKSLKYLTSFLMSQLQRDE